MLSSENKLALKAMKMAIRDQYIHPDPYTGEYNATELAEHAAFALDHDEWLDDSYHWIWEAALVVKEWAEKGK